MVKRLIQARWPDLDLSHLTEVGAGWDHAVWRCGDLLFRFPHQHESMQLATQSVDALRALSERLPVPIPTPIHVGEPTDDYPGSFVAYRYIPGELPAKLNVTIADREALAEPIAQMLKALHEIPRDVAVTWNLPSEGSKNEYVERVAYAKVRAEQLSQTPFAALAAEAATRMDPPPAPCSTDDWTLVHGDLHAGQILLDDEHRLSGVIDWDELHIGDPSYDLLIVYSFIPQAARERFWSIYGPSPVTEHARFLALSYGLAILAQAVVGGADHLVAEAAFSLKNALD